MSRFEFYIPSGDGVSRIHGLHWVPDGEVKAVLQVCHGMVDHIGRYHDFAKYLNGCGIAVVGHDHLGHGKTGDRQKHGIFAEENGAFFVLEDMRITAEYTKRQYPKIPHFMLGHSMGSFFVRRYLTIHGDTVDGVILMGTGEQSGIVLKAGTLVVKRAVKKDGRAAYNEVLHQLILGRYNRGFESEKSDHGWLSRDAEQVKRYEADRDCQFIFSNGAYEDFFQIMSDLQKKCQFERISRALPVLLVSGERDPVGDNGKGVRKVYDGFRQLGLSDVTMKLYPGARHEIINETNRREVYEDISRWLKKHI